MVDFANANYLLSFNANLFETFLSPVRYIYSYGQFRQGRPGIRGKFVHAEPRLSQTAACADEWLPDQAGDGRPAGARDGARHREREAVRRGIRRAEHHRIRGVVVRHSRATRPRRSPRRSTSRRRRFSASRGNLHSGGPAWPSATAATSRRSTAIYALNALVGAFGRPGGILFGADELSGPTAGLGRVRLRAQPRSPAAPGPSAPDILGLITAMSASQVKALLVLDTNPLFTLPEAEKLRSVLGNVPFIASFASFLDETSVMADLILPSHVTLERWIDDVPEPGVGIRRAHARSACRPAALGYARSGRRAD